MRHRLTLSPINLLNFIDVIEEVDDNPYASLDFYPWGRIEASNFDVLTFVQSALDMNFTCGSFWVLHNNVRIKLWNDNYLFIKCLFSIRALVYYFICVSEFVVLKIGKKKKKIVENLSIRVWKKLIVPRGLRVYFTLMT